MPVASLFSAPSPSCSTVVLAPAAAAVQPVDPDLPARIDLPDGIQPEGIESDAAGNFYVGSLRDGRIWTGNALTGEERILVPGEAGKVAVGLHLDDAGRLWVAGGPTQQIRVYDVATGDLLETYPFPTAGFINDLDISRNAVYATDSLNPQLLVIPLEDDGGLPDPSAATTMALTGDLTYSAGFNANGIAARGGWLVLVQSNEGLLFKVNPRTGETTQIDTGGVLVANGDGLELRGKTLYVVRELRQHRELLHADGRPDRGREDRRVHHDRPDRAGRADHRDAHARCPVGRERPVQHAADARHAVLDHEGAGAAVRPSLSGCTNSPFGLFWGLVLQPIDKLDHLLEPHPPAALQRGLEVHAVEDGPSPLERVPFPERSSSTAGGRTP